jgi:hypothetical protein
MQAHRSFFWIFLLLLAPLGAFVLITALLLFGVEPRLVFAPGRAVKGFLEVCGFHVANRVAVASTAIFVWAIIAAAGWAWDRRRAGGGT